MDTTVRINLLLIVIISIICFFIFRETYQSTHTPEGTQSTGSYLAASIKKEAQDIFDKITESNEGRVGMPPARQTPPAAPVRADAPAVEPQPSAPVRPPAAAQPEPVVVQSIPNEGRLFRRTDDGREKLVFQKTKKGKWLAPPQGFYSALTNNYLIYREYSEVSPALKKTLDELHGNFVLDVIPFSMFSKFDRILLMMFNSRETYSSYTSMPEWTIATTDIESQAIYLMESNQFKGYFVHELSHIYFDGFFTPVVSPLWLSEGFAVRMQTAVQTDRENSWIRKESRSFKNGEYIDFNEFVGVDSLAKYQGDDVLTWYAQSYSVVDYLLRNKSRDEFYQFSKNLKEGMPIGKAMYRAYGMPFNNVNALEYAWQADLQKDPALVQPAPQKTNTKKRKRS